MRKITYIASLLLCAATFAGCVNDEDAKTSAETQTLVSLTAGIETRTDFTDPATPKWSAGDAIGVHFVQAGVLDNHHRLESTSEDGHLTATFSGLVALAAGDYTVYGYYPHGDAGDQTGHHSMAKIEVPVVQRPTAKSFDPAADVMIMLPFEHSHNGTDIVRDGLYFKRALGMIKIVLNGEGLAGEPVQNLTFTTDAGIELAGTGYFDLDGGEFIEFDEGAATVVTVEPAGEVLADGTDAMLICVPVMNIPAGTTLTIEGETEGYTFTKSTVLENPVEIEAGNWHTMNVALTGADITAKETEPKTIGVWMLSESTSYVLKADLAYYDVVADELRTQVFTAENGYPLGGVANDMILRDDQLWIAVSGEVDGSSSSVKVVDAGTGKLIRNIEMRGPEGAGDLARQLVYHDGYVYVTCYFGGGAGEEGGNAYFYGGVARINADTYEIIDYLRVGDKPEGITYLDGKLYVCIASTGYGNTISVIDVASFTVEREITVPLNPYYIETASNGELYFTTPSAYLTGGGGLTILPPAVYKLDPVAGTYIKYDVSAWRLAVSDRYIYTGDFSYTTYMDDISRIDRETGEITPITLSNDFFMVYGFGVNPVTGDIYLGGQGQDVLFLNKDLEETHEFQVGVPYTNTFIPIFE